MEQSHSGEKKGWFMTRRIIVLGEPVTPNMSKKLIKLRIVKNEHQATFFLFFISIVSALLAIIVYMHFVMNYSFMPRRASSTNSQDFQFPPEAENYVQ
jgi:hypothetical protein